VYVRDKEPHREIKSERAKYLQKSPIERYRARVYVGVRDKEPHREIMSPIESERAKYLQKSPIER